MSKTRLTCGRVVGTLSRAQSRPIELTLGTLELHGHLLPCQHWNINAVQTDVRVGFALPALPAWQNVPPAYTYSLTHSLTHLLQSRFAQSDHRGPTLYVRNCSDHFGSALVPMSGCLKIT